jgi:hypothetical protein
MGHATERHDLMSRKHAAAWIGIRQPVHRVLAERQARRSPGPTDFKPGQVWEEDEFTDRRRPTARSASASRVAIARGRVTIQKYRWIFSGAGPAGGSREKGSRRSNTCAGCFLVQDRVYKTHGPS